MKDIKKTNWFEERELPNIYNDLDLLKAFSIVKNRFNGNPRCYTRNDYILFINTIYAAFRDLYYSTHLQEDLTTECLVGYVKKGHTFKKGDSLYSVLELIFTGEGDVPDTPVEPDEPVEKNAIYTNIANPVGKEYIYMDNGLVLGSNLEQYREFITLNSHSILDINKVTSDSFLYLVFAYIDLYVIETYKPIEDILKSIEVHTTNSNWPEAKDLDWKNWSVLSWFTEVEKTQEGKYIYKINTDIKSKPGLDLLSMDYLIKFIF